MIPNVKLILEKKSSEIYTISPEKTVQDAIEIMASKKISALPVVKDNHVIGIISERDYIRKAAPKRQVPWEINVTDLMTSEENLISVLPTDTIPICMQIMSKNGIRHLPVIEDDELIGMISITDAVRFLNS